MIVFVGSKEKGYFCEDVAKKNDLLYEYINADNHIETQIKEIMNYKESCEYLIFDIEQYADSVDEIVDWILKIRNAINSKIIIYAVGYSTQTEIIDELYNNGIRNYIFSNYLSDQKEDLELCMNGYYESFGYEEKRGIKFGILEENEDDNDIKINNVKTIGIAGAVKRMGTTTQALQLVKYLSYMGYKACYMEMNNHKYVESVADAYSEVLISKEDGLVQYQNVDMYYKPEKLKSVVAKGYEYIVYDFGVYSEHDFNKISFLEKDTQVFVVGSKPDEFGKTYDVIKSNFYNNVFYIFSFTADTEKKDLIELMDDKADYTFFADIANDPFTYCGSDIYGKIIPVKNRVEEVVTKKKFWKGKKKNGR